MKAIGICLCAGSGTSNCAAPGTSLSSGRALSALLALLTDDAGFPRPGFNAAVARFS
jgi:hypothetical protein